MVSKFLLDINFVALFWSSVTLVVGLLGIGILYFPRLVPPYLANLYKYGKLVPKKDAAFRCDTVEEMVQRLCRVEIFDVPKSWFVHFYVFAIIYHSILFQMMCMFCPQRDCDFLVNALDYLFGRRAGHSYGVHEVVSVTVFGLAMVHFLRRAYESDYVCVYSDSTMNVIHYLAGFAFYASVGLCLVNLHVPNKHALPVDPSVVGFSVGLTFFCIGTYIQIKSLESLADQRKIEQSDGTITITLEHVMPKGGFFEYVSCPHYLGEILIYIGLYSLTNGDNSMLALLVWVVVNQVVAAMMCHEWYKTRFRKTYPRSRRAIIPYLL